MSIPIISGGWPAAKRAAGRSSPGVINNGPEDAASDPGLQ